MYRVAFVILLNTFHCNGACYNIVDRIEIGH